MNMPALTSMADRRGEQLDQFQVDLGEESAIRLRKVC